MPTYQDMVYHLGGVPVNVPMPFIVGDTYFVSSLVGGTEAINRGTKEFPFDTLATALTHATKNDCIVLMPGHSETLNATDTFLLTTNYDGITIWGVGHYDARPLYTFGTTNSSAYVKIQAANCMIHNVRFLAGSTKQRACAIRVEAKGVHLDEIMIEDVDASTMDFSDGILLDATSNKCDGFKLTNSNIMMYSSLSNCGVNISGLVWDCFILGNTFVGHWATGEMAAVHAASTLPMANFNISHNYIMHMNDQADDCHGIYILGDNSYGIISYNVMGMRGASGSSDTAFYCSATGAVCMAENYVTTIAGKSAMLSPAVDATA